MTTTAQTLFRFAGAVLLGAAATAIDQRSRTPEPSGAARGAGVTPDAVEQRAQVVITPGKQSIAFRINDIAAIAAIAAIAQPGSRVDVVFVGGAGLSRTEAKLFLENVRLLAIGTVPQRASDGRTINAAVATIEVTPDEARRLVIAQRQGEFHLLLRGKGDSENGGRAPAVSRDSADRRRP